MADEGARIPLDRPLVPPEAAAAVADVLASGWLVRGPRVRAFEAAVAARTGAEGAVACSSGTAAAWLALLALQMPRGARVAVPDVTFVGVAHCVVFAGGEPVLVPVRSADLAMDPAALDEVAEGLWGAIVVDPFGLPIDFAPYRAIAENHGLSLVEDAACALGSVDAQGVAAGCRGDLGTYSFHPRKVVTSGEGGMVIGDDESALERARLLSDHGYVAAQRRFVVPGFNARMGEVAGAVGNASLSALDEEMAARVALHAAYREALDGAVDLVEGDASVVWNRQTLVAVLPDGADADELRALAASRGIEVGRTVQALGDEPSIGQWSAGASAAARGWVRRTVALPLFGGLERGDVDRVAGVLKEYLRAGAETAIGVQA